MGKSHLHSFFCKVTLHILGLLFYRVIGHFPLFIEALCIAAIFPFTYKFISCIWLMMAGQDWEGKRKDGKEYRVAIGSLPRSETWLEQKVGRDCCWNLLCRGTWLDVINLWIYLSDFCPKNKTTPSWSVNGTLSPSESPSGSLGSLRLLRVAPRPTQAPGLLCSQEQRLNQSSYLIHNKQNKGCWQREGAV